MSDKKLRISKDDLGGGKGENETEDKTVAIPAEDVSEGDKKQKKDSGGGKGKGKEKEAKPQDETKEQVTPLEGKGKKGFRPKLKSPIPGKGKKGTPKTKKGAGDGAEVGPATAEDQAQRGFIRRQHPMVLIGSGIALFAVCFAGTFLLIDVLKTDRQRSEDALEYSTKAMTEVQEGIDRAQKEELPYSFLQNLAEASEELAGKVEGRKRTYEAEVTDKPQLTGPTLAVMDADLEFLRSFASLSAVKDGELRNRWRQIKRDMKNAVGTIEEEAPAIQSEVSDDPALLPTESSLNTSVASVNGIVSNAADALEGWFAQLRRIKNQCERVKSFIGTSSSLVGEYRNQRNETSSFLDTPDLFWRAAVNGMNSRSQQRDGLAERMSYETPPVAAAGSWNSMVELVGESASTLRAAAEAFADGSIDSAETWQESNVVRPQFDSKSQQISSSIDSTQVGLDSGLAAAEQKTCNRKKPPRPAV